MPWNHTRGNFLRHSAQKRGSTTLHDLIDEEFEVRTFTLSSGSNGNSKGMNTNDTCKWFSSFLLGRRPHGVSWQTGSMKIFSNVKVTKLKIFHLLFGDADVSKVVHPLKKACCGAYDCAILRIHIICMCKAWVWLEWCKNITTDPRLNCRWLLDATSRSISIQ